VVEEVVVGGGEARGGGGEAEAAVELFVEGGRDECREDGQEAAEEGAYHILVWLFVILVMLLLD
jgi:hypothetical protein